MVLKSGTKSPWWDHQCLSQMNFLLQKISKMNSWHKYVIYGFLADLVLWTNIDQPVPRIEKLFQLCKIHLKYFKKYIFILMMFQTNKPMAPFLVETLEDLLQGLYWKFVWPETLEGAKIMSKLDISKRGNRVSNSKIGIGFSLEYDMQQPKSSGKITSVQACASREKRNACAEKSQLSSLMVRCLRCLSPMYMSESPEACELLFAKMLIILVCFKKNFATVADSGKKIIFQSFWKL